MSPDEQEKITTNNLIAAMLRASSEASGKLADSISIPEPPKGKVTKEYFDSLITLNAAKLGPLIQAYAMASGAQLADRDQYREKAHACIDAIYDAVDRQQDIAREALK